MLCTRARDGLGTWPERGLRKASPATRPTGPSGFSAGRGLDCSLSHSHWGSRSCFKHPKSWGPHGSPRETSSQLGASPAGRLHPPFISTVLSLYRQTEQPSRAMPGRQSSTFAGHRCLGTSSSTRPSEGNGLTQSGHAERPPAGAQLLTRALGTEASRKRDLPLDISRPEGTVLPPVQARPESLPQRLLRPDQNSGLSRSRA